MAANSLDYVIQTQLAKGLEILRSKVIMPALVSRETGDLLASKQGQTIQVPIYDEPAVNDVTASSTPISPSGTVTTYADVKLDQWKETNYKLDDQEISQILDIPDFQSQKLMGSMNSLAKDINAYILALADDAPAAGKPGGIYNAVGTAGTTPFASKLDIINDAGRFLNINDAPMVDRYAVLDYLAGANARNLDKMSKVNERGNAETLLNGILGRAYGFDFYEDGQIPYHTSSGTASTMTIVAASTSNALIVNMADSAGTFSVGDILEISGGIQTYMVNAAVQISSGVSGTISVTPAVSGSFTSGTAITHSANHRINLAFQRGAFAFAQRPLGNAGNLLGLSGLSLGMAEITDPMTGLSLRLEVIRQNKQFVWQFDVLYGCTLIKPELAVRIMG